MVTGDLDTFYLEGAVRLLKESLTKLGSDAVVVRWPERYADERGERATLARAGGSRDNGERSTIRRDCTRW